MPHTVMVTGATGYIGKHLVLQLLEAGHNVTASTRDLEREPALRETLAKHLSDETALERLSVVALDLTSDEGWDIAMYGADVLMHTASPFPMAQPKNEDDLIRPAIDGALRAVKAARKAGIKRVIMTSSFAAISCCDLPPGRDTYNESNWTDTKHPSANAYVKSKTLAEQDVWDWATSQAPEMAITMINPVLVVGAPLDGEFGTSVDVIARLLRGTDPMLPRVGMPCVDVRDVALMHLRAMDRPDSAGKRFIAYERFLWFKDVADLLRAAFPNKKIAKRLAPNVLIRVLSLFDTSLRTIVPLLGVEQKVSNTQACTQLDMKFRGSDDAIRETGAFLVANDLL